MSRDRSPWRDGRRAWERLDGWHDDGPAGPGHPDGGNAALQALADVGAIRRLLDRVELVAVRTARRHGKSWTEIATTLGVTRQSAWERWRDLDDVEVPPPARTARRRSSIRVPNVIGRSWDEARHALLEVGLVAVGSDPDDPPAMDRWTPGFAVTDQSPESGAKVPAGASVRLWIGRGGGSAGVREPRRPMPAPKSVQAMRYEGSDESDG